MTRKTPVAQREAFNEVLKRHRADAGLTQLQLAERAGLSVRAISDLERGVKRRPHPYTVRHLATALDLDPQDLVEFREASNPPGTGRQAHAQTPSARINTRGHQAAAVLVSVLVAVAVLLTIRATGHFARSQMSETSSGSGPGQFHGPTGIAVDASGRVYVVDRGNDRVQEFSSDGSFLSQWGTHGYGPHQFDRPGDIAISSTGDIYVGDHGNSRISVFRDGRQIDELEFDSGGLAVDIAGNIYDVIPRLHLLRKFDASRRHQTLWRLPAIIAGRFPFPAGVAVDSERYLYLADRQHDRIVKLAPSGTEVAHFGRPGTAPGEFDKPTDVAIDSGGNLYVVDAGNNRIQTLAPDGRFLASWGRSGGSPGRFERPSSIALDAQGNVLVSDYFNDRVQKFSPKGTLIWSTQGRQPIRS